MAETIENAVTTLENKDSGKLSLSKDVFGLPPRADLLKRYVIWQLAKRQQGTHKTKTYGEVAGSTRKIIKQKGTGGACHGGTSAPKFTGGGCGATAGRYREGTDGEDQDVAVAVKK